MTKILQKRVASSIFIRATLLLPLCKKQRLYVCGKTPFTKPQVKRLKGKSEI